MSSYKTTHRYKNYLLFSRLKAYDAMINNNSHIDTLKNIIMSNTIEPVNISLIANTDENNEIIKWVLKENHLMDINILQLRGPYCSLIRTAIHDLIQEKKLILLDNNGNKQPLPNTIGELQDYKVVQKNWPGMAQFVFKYVPNLANHERYQLKCIMKHFSSQNIY